ncbi:hypothetical protein AMS68_004607 [Peltaster fructicola]|uniref:RNA polymerase II holoenzyme cyclin-like subunit n=1 Tax=Peltaster fructicola TaxID=286661 RepID=A0A6H0XXD9_9PEZI|nr:hypothetical protein AMS68_004607 [Peltaster fructicola]
MAANYWDSTQAKYWTFTRPELASMREELSKTHLTACKKYPLPELRHMSIYMQNQLHKLAKPMSLRQQALATAQVYIKRFYLCAEIRKTNPYLIMATAVYLACKMEECPQHIRLMLGEAARRWPELGVTETSKIGECEFALISTLNSRLILHHPYRALAELQMVFYLSSEENNLAQAIVNDSYNTDLSLLYPPHVIAIVANFLAIVLRPAQTASMQASPSTPGGASNSPITPAVSSAVAQTALAGSTFRAGNIRLAKMIEWLAETEVDMEAVVDATQEMISLYECWESYNERACKEGITKFMKDSTK